MKKLICMLAALLLVLASASAFAEQAVAAEEPAGASESFTILNESLQIEDSFGMKTAYVFAEIKNESDGNIVLDQSVALLKDKDGKNMKNITMLRMFPDALAPGQVGYVYGFKVLEDGQEPVSAEFSLAVTSTSFYTCEMLETADPQFIIENNSFGAQERYLTAKVINNGSEDLTGVMYCFVAKDKATGGIVEIYENGLYDSVIIPPQGSVIVRQNLVTNNLELDPEKYDILFVAYKTNMMSLE